MPGATIPILAAQATPCQPSEVIIMNKTLLHFFLVCTSHLAFACAEEDSELISDAGVSQLRSLSLTSLTIYQAAGVTDQGLEWLSSLEQLKSLTLRDVSATCAALGRLPHPEKLRSLNVAQAGTAALYEAARQRWMAPES